MRFKRLILNSLPILYNKYFIAVAAFLLYTLVFDTNNLSSQFRMMKLLNKLKVEKEFYINEIQKDSISLQLLNQDMNNLERFAREKYLMKRDNEDIFLIIDDSVSYKNNL